MGIISDSNSDKNTNNGEKIKEETEKFPQDNIKKGNNKKKDFSGAWILCSGSFSPYWSLKGL